LSIRIKFTQIWKFHLKFSEWIDITEKLDGKRLLILHISSH
jgi:hypothetical protein